MFKIIKKHQREAILEVLRISTMNTLLWVSGLRLDFVCIATSLFILVFYTVLQPA